MNGGCTLGNFIIELLTKNNLRNSENSSIITYPMFIGFPLRTVYSVELFKLADQMSGPKDCPSEMY